ncbi:MAG: META domain-containing protein [Giesbergeria sp.]
MAHARSPPRSIPRWTPCALPRWAQKRQEWAIEHIAGAGVIDNSHATLQFFADGRLAGSATCNRIIGSYTSEGQTLSIAPVGTTMMACPEALMNQEKKLLDLLPKLESYRMDATGALVLRTGYGREILARR